MNNGNKKIQEKQLNINFAELFEHLHDQYVDHYNETNLVKAQADFSSILSQLEATKQRKLDAIGYRISEFKKFIQSYSENDKVVFYDNSLGIEKKEDFFNHLSELSVMADKFTTNTSNFSKPDNHLFIQILNTIRGLYESVAITTSLERGFAKNMEIIRKYRDLKKLSINQSAIMRVEDQMIGNNYLSPLQRIGELPEKKQKEMKKEALKGIQRDELVDSHIHNIATSIDNDGRSPYKYCHVKAYLETYHYIKSLRSVRRRREVAVERLKKEDDPYKKLNKAGDNVLGKGDERSPGWEKKLDDALQKNR